jgi:hypothetical protein
MYNRPTDRRDLRLWIRRRPQRGFRTFIDDITGDVRLDFDLPGDHRYGVKLSYWQLVRMDFSWRYLVASYVRRVRHMHVNKQVTLTLPR